MDPRAREHSRPRAAPGPRARGRFWFHPHPPTWWPVREGARQLGEGGLCLLDSPVETAGVGGGPPSEHCGQLLFPHTTAPPPGLNVAVCHPPSPSRGIGGGGAGKRQGHSLLPQGPRLPRFFQLSSQEFNPVGEGDAGIFFFLMSSLGPTLNSWAHLRAGPGLAEASPPLSPSPPIISPLGPHLDNTISLPPLWLGLPAPKPLARGGVSWGQFGLNPPCAHPPVLPSDI